MIDFFCSSMAASNSATRGNPPYDANETVHLAHFLSATDESTPGSKQYNR